MRIRLLKGIATSEGFRREGMVLDLPERMARSLVEGRLAVSADDERAWEPERNMVRKPKRNMLRKPRHNRGQ